MKRAAGILVLAFVFSPYGYAQNGSSPAPQVIPPSPNAAAFAKYGSIPVSTYTGVPEISVPLYEINYRDIKVPVTLSYHAGGVKVGEEASQVGLGWVLNCNGVISRSIMNQDDFAVDPGSYLNPSNYVQPLPQGLVPTGLVHASGDLNHVEFANADNIPNQETRQYFNFDSSIEGHSNDYEADIFSYNFMGYTGKFVLDRAGVPILEKRDKIQIKQVNNGLKWEVKTADGFLYNFDKVEYYIDNEHGGAQIRSSWYLTQITSPQGTVVSFSYDDNGIERAHPVGSFFQIQKPYGIPVLNMCGDPSLCQGSSEIITSRAARYYTKAKLMEINWDNGKLVFDYGPREDVENDERLRSIDVYRPGSGPSNLEINFDYYYFTSIAPNFINAYYSDASFDNVRKRLMLRSVFKQEGSGPRAVVERTSFDYYDDNSNEQMPAKTSYSRDHWGYYNGKQNTSLIPSFQLPSGMSQAEQLENLGIMGPEREVDPNFSYALALKSITYPTAGSTKFIYASHDYDPTNNPTYPAPAPYETSYTINFDALSHAPDYTIIIGDLKNQYVDKFGHTRDVRIDVTFRLKDRCPGDNSPCEEIFCDTGGIVLGGTAGFGIYGASQGNTNSQTINVGLGSCTPRSKVLKYSNSMTMLPTDYRIEGTAPPSNSDINDMTLNITYWADPVKLPLPGPPDRVFANAGGLRIKQIEDYDYGSEEPVNVRTFDYSYTANENGDTWLEKHSTGRLMGYPQYAYFDKLSDEQGYTTVTTNCENCVMACRQSDSNIQLGGSRGCSVGYDKVTETIGVHGEGGQIEYYYKNEPLQVHTWRYPLFNDQLGRTVVAKPPAIAEPSNPLNGQLAKKILKNAAGITIQENIYTYYPTEAKLYRVYSMEKRDLKTATSLADPTRILFYPSLWSTFFYQNGVTQTNYDVAGNVTATTSTSYNYDMDLWYGDDLNRHKQLKYTSTTKSNGDIVTTSYLYPGDFLPAESDETVGLMQGDRFMHSRPLVVTQSVYNTNTNPAKNGIVHRDINKYGTVNGKVVLTNKFSTELTTPVTSLPVYTPSLVTMPEEYKPQVTIDYDADGNAIKVVKKDDYPVGFLWGYNKAHPTVQVINATIAEVFYDGYEGQAITGSHTAPLGVGNGYKAGGTLTVNFQPPSNRRYVLSYKYYEGGAWKSTIVPYAPNASNVYGYDINQGQHLDEIRVYPADATLTTITYDVLYGKTSETDSNNRTTFYEHDVLGRLIGIRDNAKNIVKKIKYNYIIH